MLDAAGFDRILIETVGVGQSELAVTTMADTTVLVLVPESGDGIQALKSGIMEIADVYAVNKADRPGAGNLAREIESTIAIRQGRAYRGMRGHHGVSGPAGPGTPRPDVGPGPVDPAGAAHRGHQRERVSGAGRGTGSAP